MKILLGNFNAKFGREDIFKPAIGNEILHQDSIDIGVRIVNFATSKKTGFSGPKFSAPKYLYIHLDLA
jgi:hypothetical protein